MNIKPSIKQGIIFILAGLCLTSSNFAKNYSDNNAISGFCSTEILAEPWQHGYTWTLTSRLGELLDRAERAFGERDKSWTLLGVEFSTNDYPQTWYPGVSEGRKDIIVQITDSSAQDQKRAIFQMAHEVIHLLSPDGKPNSSTVLEEGLATYFSIHVMLSMGYDISPSYIGSPAYEAAYWQVKRLIDNHDNAFATIKTLRTDSPFSQITPKQLLKRFKNLKEPQADILSTNFKIFSSTKAYNYKK